LGLLRRNSTVPIYFKSCYYFAPVHVHLRTKQTVNMAKGNGMYTIPCLPKMYQKPFCMLYRSCDYCQWAFLYMITSIKVRKEIFMIYNACKKNWSRQDMKLKINSLWSDFSSIDLNLPHKSDPSTETFCWWINLQCDSVYFPFSISDTCTLYLYVNMANHA